MAQAGRAPGRMQGQSETWPPRSAVAAGGLSPSGIQAWPSFTARLREWVAAEAGAGRLFPWVPVAFGVGIAVYFAADHEPVLPVVMATAVAFGAAALLCRRRKLFPAAVVIAAVAAGFAAATLANRADRPCGAVTAGLCGAALRASSKPATSASAPTGSCCASTEMETPRDARSQLERVRLVGAQGHRARGRQLRRIEGAAAAAARAVARRAATILPATCIFRASAPPAS